MEIRFTRRALMATACATSVISSWPVNAKSRLTIDELLDATMNKILVTMPQLLTLTGLDTGINSGARAKLDDRSPIGLERLKSIFKQFRSDLGDYDPKSLKGRKWVDQQSAIYLADTVLESYSFPFGDPYVGVAIPYIISQLTGSYRSVPSFLASQHPVNNPNDAEAYLSRMAAFATLLDSETERSREDYNRHAAPPSFVLRTSLAQLDALIAPESNSSEIVTALMQKASKVGLPSQIWGTRAARIMEREIKPALLRQRNLLQSALATATDNAGVWRLPRGEEYYAFAIRAATTVNQSGDEIHRLGLELVERYSREADELLRQQGYTKGTIAERIRYLRRDPVQLFEDSDAGREELLAYLEQVVDGISNRIKPVFTHMPKAHLKIQRMSPSVEAGASGAIYQPPSLDGSRPGLFSINLAHMAEWPRFDLPTLVYHEGLPGHHLQNSLLTETKGIPLMRRLPVFSGMEEGWAMYAEQLADELGAYQDYPLGRLGYLASMLFRAARLVVDSGLHHRRWDREAAIKYMRETLGNADTEVAREVERYCVEPGQACSYMLGWQAWTGARSSVRERLGSKFDIRMFHDEMLSQGDMPLEVLKKVASHIPT